MTGRTVIVLGATGGLGRAVTERFRDEGASVLALDARIPDAGKRQDQVEYVAVDALDETSVSAAFARAPSAAAVVNLIGGYTPPQGLAMLDIGVLRQQFELNLVSAAIVTKYAIPLLAARGGGAIVHVSSRVALEKWETAFSYSVSKL
ncbi:MAG TPA: SDR family NAD(P)-dependent oxidoreductase, partial [Streptosporangiaceae bacterium]|nr:SDR family NAD(P)-dependent oxidoreductase [Streptosporangiaceae bacterium]